MRKFKWRLIDVIFDIEFFLYFLKDIGNKKLVCLIQKNS
jgi:hypothetical protein